MLSFSIWEIVNVICRLGVAAVVVVKLVSYYDLYKLDERIGLGIAGGCSMLTAVELAGIPYSPFRGWSAALFAFGVLVYFIGRLRRQMRHRRANREQLRYYQERGRLSKERN